MNTSVPVVSSVRTLAGPAALRSLARAFAHIADFAPFVEMLEASLGKAAFFERAEISLTGGEAPPPEGFAGGQFTLPITGAEGLHGVLKLASPGKVFGPEDLHLMAALAGVLASVFDHARKHGELRKNLDLLAILLNAAPVGLVALDVKGQVISANDLARRWLDAGTLTGLAEKLKPEAIGVDWRAATSFHLQAGDRLLYAEVRACGDEAKGTAVYGLALVDLGPEQTRLVDGLQRELYRCRWLEKPLAFALVESERVTDGVLRMLPELRAALRGGELVGPYDAFHVGIVLPEHDASAALARLRELGSLLPAKDVRLGVAYEGKSETAAALIEAARGALQPTEETLRRTLLLHDDYPAVNDMIEMVLGRRFHIVKSTRIDATRELLRTRPFDGLFTEVELRNGASGIELAQFAKKMQPAIRPYFTTVAHVERLSGLDPVLDDHVVVRKPFDVTELDKTMRATLA